MNPLAVTAPPLTERINRIGFSATLAAATEADRMKAAGIDLADFGAGEPHFSTPEHIKLAGIAAIERDFTKYTPVGGVTELRRAICARHAQDFGSDYAVEEAAASSGGKQALFNAVQALVSHGDEVIVPAPYWVSFKDIVRYAGGDCVFVETDEANGFALRPEMVERLITARTRAIILNSPCNPSGAVAAPEDLERIVELAHRRGIYVISDECYVYLNYSGRLFSVGSLTGCREHLVLIGSLSKTYSMTGWRMGYALGPRTIISAMQKLQGQSTGNPNSIAQAAAIAALTGSQQCVAEMRADYILLRDRMLAGLKEIPGMICHRPEGAFYLYPNVAPFFGRGGMNSSEDV
ncbi:MAG: pyridoxal phosphate-dependent aminotransferase, partial [Acidobacteria bacterium]|nr:pyridoxal phosphate-dependent aminotransferase [Acidobacteriota bacterium]